MDVSKFTKSNTPLQKILNAASSAFSSAIRPRSQDLVVSSGNRLLENGFSVQTTQDLLAGQVGSVDSYSPDLYYNFTPSYSLRTDGSSISELRRSQFASSDTFFAQVSPQQKIKQKREQRRTKIITLD